MPVLQDHLEVETTQCMCINVSDVMLTQIQETFVVASIVDNDSELILDCARLIEPESQADLRKILAVPDDTEIPTTGYLVFWN